MDIKDMKDKWLDPVFHALEITRELSAAENHAIQYINTKDPNEKLKIILEKIRNIRKRIEDDLYGKSQ